MAGDARAPQRIEPVLDGRDVRTAVVAGRFNDLVTFRLLDGVDLAGASEDLDQALERSEDPGGHNVGEESAHTAVEMVRLLERIRA